MNAGPEGRANSAQGRRHEARRSGPALKIRFRSTDPPDVKKVLVIDDSETVRQQVQQALGPAGYQILEAVDGIDGLDKLRADSEISAVLCDVNMPRMTGLEVAARAHEEGLTPPIVMLTSEGQPSLVRRARESGARGWIVKPFRVDQLLAVMDKITRR
jgi:two-component system chemotaxis response regulator CheY